MHPPPAGSPHVDTATEAELAREFNRRLLRARITALATVEELAAPPPQPHSAPTVADPQDAAHRQAHNADRRLTHNERALRLRAAATILRQRPIKPPQEEPDNDHAPSTEPPPQPPRSTQRRPRAEKPIPPPPHPFEGIQGWRSHPIYGDAHTNPHNHPFPSTFNKDPPS